MKQKMKCFCLHLFSNKMTIFIFSSLSSTSAWSWFAHDSSKWQQKATKSSWHCIDPWKIKVTREYPLLVLLFGYLNPPLSKVVLSSIHASMSCSRSSQIAAIIFIGCSWEGLITVFAGSIKDWRQIKQNVNTPIKTHCCSTLNHIDYELVH